MSKRLTSIKCFLSLAGMFSIGSAIASPIWNSTHTQNISYKVTQNGTKIESCSSIQQRDGEQVGLSAEEMRNINVRMNSTVINSVTATSLDTLDTSATLTKTGNVSGQPITYYTPYTICDYVQLNTYNLPKAAQITYVVGFTTEDIQDRVILGSGESFKNSLCGKYSEYSGITGNQNTVLNVAAYSNMIYNDGILQTGQNYLLATTKFNSIGNRPDPLSKSSRPEQTNGWTFGLKTNTTDSGSLNISIIKDESFDLQYSQNKIKDAFIIPTVASASGTGVQDFRLTFDQAEINNPTNYEYKNQWLGTLTATGNPSLNIPNIPVPGINYRNPDLNVFSSLRYEITKEDLFPSEYNNVTVANLVNFASQGFVREEISYNRKYYNDLLGKITVEVVGVAAPLDVNNENGENAQTKLPYVYTIHLDGLKSWMPVIVAVVCGTLAIIFFVISMILLNKTSENKKYKLVRRTL